MADVYLARGDETRARQHLQDAIAATIDPELGRRMLRFWPQIAGYRVGPTRDRLLDELRGDVRVGDQDSVLRRLER